MINIISLRGGSDNFLSVFVNLGPPLSEAIRAYRHASCVFLMNVYSRCLTYELPMPFIDVGKMKIPELPTRVHTPQAQLYLTSLTAWWY